MDEDKRQELKTTIQSMPGGPSEEVKQLLVLAEIYRLLSTKEMNAVRRAAVYPRLLSKKYMDDKELYTPLWKQAWYVIFPVLLFMLCFAIQSFFLHIATAFYVRYMDRLQNSVESLGAKVGSTVDLAAVEGGELFDLVARMAATNSTSDPTEAVRDGNIKIPMIVLDLSGIIPAFLCVSCFAYSFVQKRFHIGLWYKTFLIACCMAIMKGVLDVVTVLPDSIGWQQCKDRLGEVGLQKMLHRHFFTDFAHTMAAAISDEIFGVEGKRIRYCADMMISGHTYFACLFSLAAYKLTGAIELTKRVQFWVGLLCAFCVFLEVALVAAARFHYTVDMITSVILVVLLWDSLYLEQVASDWSEGYSWQDPRAFAQQTCCGRTCGPGKDSGGKLGKPRVLPSQSTHLINMRMLSGSPSWRDDVDGNGAASGGDELCGQGFLQCEVCQPLIYQHRQGAQP
ncbi:unnamed protein product [Effrenium voratum]|uniref:Sphingomyelin synthase-like domain-containing protein n=1 Tax=Effrenium voratum TaxID=2562239 RepID=A0AA36N9Z4_9DINO|nr:unnamed protein product [Effrenium voratum]